MKKMGKKGEFVILSIILLVTMIAGIVIYQGNIENKNYIGDSSTMTVYYIKSNESNCNLTKLKIDEGNLKLFETKEEAFQENYRLDENCR